MVANCQSNVRAMVVKMYPELFMYWDDEKQVWGLHFIELDVGMESGVKVGSGMG